MFWAISQDIFGEKKGLCKLHSLSKSLGAKLKNKVVSDKKYDITTSTPLRLIDVVKNEASISPKLSI
ncbi:BEM_HP_G0118650.mRNA.1.CDS.1 [Saccharomyces cerevisiae]|nr:BEM_HP_G0118650.mRNA.1.CDS.1 [Saccharomyces cerevisiae]CAI6403201.1 BEM_HP_G0118650.mRNA.1.CDS.1 [Saccharomyces cerevisiae]